MMDYEDVEEMLGNKITKGSNGEFQSLEKLAEKIAEVSNKERKKGKPTNRPQLTDKQEKALGFCLEQTRNSPKKKRYLKSELLKQGYYKDNYQAKKALKFFLKNESLPLKDDRNKVVNTE